MTYLLSKLSIFKIYQFSAHSLQVIIESNIQPGIPPIPILPTPKANQNSSSTPSPSKWLCPFNNSNISPNKKKSPIKSNKAGSSSCKLWKILKNLHQYDCVLNSSQIFTFVTTYCSFIQYLAWPCYLTLYACNLKIMDSAIHRWKLSKWLEGSGLCHLLAILAL